MALDTPRKSRSGNGVPKIRGILFDDIGGSQLHCTARAGSEPPDSKIRILAKAAGQFHQGSRTERCDAIRPCSTAGSPLLSPCRRYSPKAASPTPRGATRCKRIGAKRLFRKTATPSIFSRAAAAASVRTPEPDRTPCFASSGGGCRVDDLEHSACQGYSRSDGRRRHSTANRSGTCGIAILLTRIPLRGRRRRSTTSSRADFGRTGRCFVGGASSSRPSWQSWNVSAPCMSAIPARNATTSGWLGRRRIAMRHPDWEKVVSAAARLQLHFPDAVLVGGTAAFIPDIAFPVTRITC